jgi:hypothetical protein
MFAERSADITLNLESGISNKIGSYKITMPSGEIYDEAIFLPRFARQRTIWGFDSRAFPEEGKWLLEITIKGDQGTHSAKIPIWSTASRSFKHTDSGFGHPANFGAVDSDFSILATGSSIAPHGISSLVIKKSSTWLESYLDDFECRGGEPLAAKSSASHSNR